jgi:hypothetical protein
MSIHYEASRRRKGSEALVPKFDPHYTDSTIIGNTYIGSGGLIGME